MSRRSTGRNVPRKRYTTDAFEGIEELQDEIGERSPIRHSRDSDSAEEFNLDAEAGAEDGSSGDEMSGAEMEEQSDPASDAGEKDLDDRASIADDQDIVRTISRPAKPRALKYRTGQTLHNRGIPDGVQRKGVKRVRQLFLFGSSADDTETVRKAIYRWAFEDTLPTRKQPDENGTGGFQPSYWHGEEGRAKEAAESWRWYHHDGGREAFEDRQFDDNISSEASQEFLPEGSERSFLMGPYQTPKLFKLGVCETMSLSQAWEATEANGSEHSQQSDQTKRHGFMINVGSKVWCSEWAPNQSGPDQYLAVSALSPRALVPGQQFKPQQPHAASIQLWRFRANVKGVIRMDEQPFLDTLLCTRWGDVKAIKWCPAPHEEPVDSNNINLGLLAGVWGDGALRVLDIRTQAGKEATSYRLVTKPAFEAAPPGTVFNSVTWVNSTRIAAGCANGCVAIFDLPNSLFTNPPKPPRPCFFASIATGYILSLASAYPSHPNLLITTSTDGYARLTDLTSPNPSSFEATVQAPRARSTQELVVWNDFCQAGIMIDDNFSLKGLPLRRFFTTVALGRSTSAGTALATSPCHPFVLIGSANGEVTGSNPMRRIVESKYIPLLQKWFAHEWRRPAPGDKEKGFGEYGLARFTEGYKVYEGQRNYNEGAMRDGKRAKEHGLYFHTVYEEETAVTALAWNPNPEYGGWAAAGCADGLLRVEDLVPV